MPTLSPDHMITAIARDCGHTKATVKAVLDSLSMVATGSIAAGETVTIANLARLKPTTRAERRQRNPRTGEMMVVPTHKSVKATATPAVMRAITQTA